MNASRVLFTSIELFLQFGVKSVNMDQIASSCGMSKKTLYKHVKNKEDLLEKAFEQVVSFMKSELEEAISSIEGNAIDQLFAMERFAEVQGLGFYYRRQARQRSVCCDSRDVWIRKIYLAPIHGWSARSK